jgi:MFS family permease
MALVLDVVERKDLLQATAANFFGMTAMGIIIPLVAGGIVQSFDISWAYVLMGMTSFLAPLALLGLRGLENSKRERRSPVRDFKEGVSYVFSNPMIRTLLFIGIIVAIFGWGSEAMYPVMAKDVLHAGPLGAGLLFAAANAGGLLAALVMSSIGDIRNKGRMLILGYLSFGSFLILFALSPWLLVSLLLIGLAGLSSAIAETSMDTLVQSSVSDKMRGRVLSVQAFNYGASGSAGIYIGSVAALLGAPLAIAIGGGVMVLHALRLVRGRFQRFVEPHTGSITSG